MTDEELLEFARSVDPKRAPQLRLQFAEGGALTEGGAALATAVVAAFPAFGAMASSRPSAFSELSQEGWRLRRTRQAYLTSFTTEVGALTDGDAVRSALRRAVQYEKLRIATRELMPRSMDGADVDVTSAEISDLAEAALEIALAEAQTYARGRWGVPLTAAGQPATFVVIGMGKLGGRELNAGSDVDLIYFYDTDEGYVDGASGRDEISLHEYWSHVARRLTANVDTATDDGTVWRVDLRLRPEGSRGPIVNSVPAAERYYETFGRLWERSAMLRARPVAGDLALGQAALDELSPFIYARLVDPSLAVEIVKLVDRARGELSDAPERDLKLGPGGIREAEFFVQALQLIWGGKEVRVRATGTLDALSRLRGRGLVTDREGREVADAYVLFRRVEHRIQWSTGLQTHALPVLSEDRERMARSLGYSNLRDFDDELHRARSSVRSRFFSLLPPGIAGAPKHSRWSEIIHWLDEADPEALEHAIARAFGSSSTVELCRDVRQLGRRPDDLLGAMTRERFPDLCSQFLDALIDAADPEQAARYMRSWLSRLGAPGVYVRPLGEDHRALRRLVGAFGASAFIGNAIANRPELGEGVVWTRRLPNPKTARAEVDDEVAEVNLWAASGDDPDAFVGALRRAKARITIEVALADLAGEISTREATLTLSSLADATLEQATRFALGAAGAVRGLAVIAVGKLGGNEIGYGSDLDVLFVFDPKAAPAHTDADAYFAQRAQRVIRLLSTAHAEGTGYDLDTRLRPSGSNGLLVASLEGFARYHDVSLPDSVPESHVPSAQQSGAPWERQALVRARFAAGDAELGQKVIAVTDSAAYEREPPAPAEIHRLRMRMEKELGRERPGRHDFKVGRGGLCDIEFAVQYLQMKNGRDEWVRTPETPVAIVRLAERGLLRADLAQTFTEGYRFLRRLEQRTRIVHATSACLLEESAAGLLPLARRLGMRDTPRSSAKEELIARYRAMTDRVRSAYLEVMT